VTSADWQLVTGDWQPFMPRYRRTDRLNEQLREEISLLVRDQVRDPRVGLVTITSVETSRELDHARVYFTTLGDEAEKEAAEAGLRSAASFLRGQLGRRLHLRRVPELHFEIDRKLAEAQRIEALLREALPDGGDEDEPAAGQE
jgi:ribosome-binding factor A